MTWHDNQSFHFDQKIKRKKNLELQHKVSRNRQVRSEVLALSSVVTSPLEYLFVVVVWQTGNTPLQRLEEIHPSCNQQVGLITRQNWTQQNLVTRFCHSASSTQSWKAAWKYLELPLLFPCHLQPQFFKVLINITPAIRLSSGGI